MTSRIVDTSREVKECLMDRVALMDGGVHKMKIIGVGNSCPDEDTIYLHLSSLTKKHKGARRDHPVQYCGWFYLPHIEFAA